MRRSWPIWTTFAVCLAVVLAPMGWVSVKVVQLDRAEAEARRQTAVEENASLALWRMDSALAPLVAQETARPYSVYRAVLSVDRAGGGKSGGKGQPALVASPLATAETPFVRLHFQIEPDGKVTSPRTKGSPDLVRLTALVQSQRLIDRLPESRAAPVELVQNVNRDNPAGQNTSNWINANPFLLAPGPQLPQAASDSAQQVVDAGPQQQALPQVQQIARSQNDFQRRSQAVSQNREYMVQAQVANTVGVASMLPSTDLAGVAMTPLWLDDQLFLARRVVIGGREYVQGCWLDWPRLQSALLVSIAELLPEARLEPSPSGVESGQGRMLAALPIRLIPGNLPADPPTTVSPLLLSLPIAWTCMLVAAAAVGLLLAGVLRLSERRATFVSAVTHELRTPLTTFHLYTEMLSEGMVSDPQQRQAYLQTLRREAARLTRLVENVLSFARLERGRHGNRLEEASVASLVAASAERLEAHARESGMTLCMEIDSAAGPSVVRANRSSVEQILFNLIDNACKYAGGAEDKRIHIAARTAGRRVWLVVSDHGPGLDAAARRRLFDPFSRSAQDAAGTAPGVGLGLALCARLARDMGARLRPDAAAGVGAAFALELPVADTRS